MKRPHHGRSARRSPQPRRSSGPSATPPSVETAAVRGLAAELRPRSASDQVVPEAQVRFCRTFARVRRARRSASGELSAIPEQHQIGRVLSDLSAGADRDAEIRRRQAGVDAVPHHRHLLHTAAPVAPASAPDASANPVRCPQTGCRPRRRTGISIPTEHRQLEASCPSCCGAASTSGAADLRSAPVRAVGRPRPQPRGFLRHSLARW